MRTIDEIQARLASLLSAAGCLRYTADELRADARECWVAITSEDGGDEPFCNFVVDEFVAMFTFYGPTTEIYILQVYGDERAFIDHFEPLAMTDVAEARSILTERFEKDAPDVVLNADESKRWLASDD